MTDVQGLIYAYETDSALGELNGLFVARVRYTADGSGEKSEITLKKEKVLCG